MIFHVDVGSYTDVKYVSTKKMQYEIKNILGRAASIFDEGIKDYALAGKMGVAPQKLSNWRTRNTIPWEDLYTFAEKYGLNLKWLLTGEGPMKKDDPAPRPADPAEAQAQNHPTWEKIAEDRQKEIDFLRATIERLTATPKNSRGSADETIEKSIQAGKRITGQK